MVIGSGPGGYVAALRAAQLGLKTACIEKSAALGGTCLNVGCIPSKALLHSTELYAKLSHEYAANGIDVKGASFSLAKMMERKAQIVAGFNKGIEGLFVRGKVDWIKGEAKLKSATQIEVKGQIVEAKNIILAMGSEPIALPFLPFDEKKVVSSTGALCLEKVPKKLLIVGAGIIGVELGSVYRRLGAEVSCIEFLDRICPALDLGLSKALQKSLTAQGIQFHLSHKVTSANVGATIALNIESASGQQKMEADVVLVAVGRRPNSQTLDLVKKDPKGFVVVDSQLRTSIPNIYAIGDLIDGPMLAHKASEEGTAVAELLAGQNPVIDYASIPNVAYTSPEVASVGFTEEELKAKSVRYKAGQSPFKANSRARCTGEEEGFVKVLAEERTKKILGIHIIGAHASELIAEATLAIRTRATAAALAHLPNAHPTLSEAIKEAATSLI